ncbi:FadR/GntR family transcriptional regulator [Devosia rhodophyticola]|uniref:FadR/GntR family transcriptional regulator n=1 Tax=Devosia rhodophyticola TaxID=3026423 RepID=A0ABY7YZP6_9HYPH|nr:FadR/GntR family transcriptional regulator [Devosia rhodophyticola]WDR06709.1 FadR/GntR family transcriptional regulator [Devosia rhodophyticola]
MTKFDDDFALLVNASKSAPAAPKDFGGGALERQSISEQVANRIMAMIKSGNLKSGDRLPTEAQMGIAFAISRPPLREALKALVLMGVLESRQGGRYTVTDLSPSRLIAPFNVMLSVADYDVDEHFEARAVVDLELVRLCAERATPEVRNRILRLARDGRAFHHDPVAFRLMDIEFHQSINKGARNGLLSALAQGLYDVALDVRREASTVPGVIEKSVEQHCAVADAIMAGNSAAAVEAYRIHLEHVRDTTKQSMGHK